MKKLIAGLTLFSFLTTLGHAAEKKEFQKNPFPGKIFAPEMVLFYADKIDLAAKQRENIMMHVNEAKQIMTATQERYKRSMEELGNLLGREQTDEDDARRKLEEVFGLEQKMKVAQWTVLVRIKNQLSVAQRAKLTKLSHDFKPEQLSPPGDLRKRLETRMEKLKAGIRELTELGVDPAPIAELMKPFQSLLSTGRFKEAEDLLDQAIKKTDKPF